MCSVSVSLSRWGTFLVSRCACDSLDPLSTAFASILQAASTSSVLFTLVRRHFDTLVALCYDPPRAGLLSFPLRLLLLATGHCCSRLASYPAFNPISTSLDLSETPRTPPTFSATHVLRLAPGPAATMGQQGSQLLSDIEATSNFNSKEIQRLKKRFMKLDRDGSGSIDKDEFLQIPQIANNPLALRLIAIFDEDGGGTVDFQEFVAGLSAFSNQGSREEKLRFAFKVYDMDRDGLISNGELFLVLKMMVGNNLKDQQLQQIVDKTIMEADTNGDGKLDFEEFQAMVANTDVAKQLTLEDLF